MAQIKIMKFIAALRKEKGMMQEQPGEKLCVTNKTISRRENGSYMHDIEMLSYTPIEKIVFFKKKRLKEHIAAIIL